MQQNILTGGIEELGIIKQNLKELNDYKLKKKELDTSEKKLGKEVINKEKAIRDEIAKTIKQRKAAVEAIYDEPIEAARTKANKIHSKRGKYKKIAVNERINSETEESANENKDIKYNKKSIFKQEKLPFIFNNRLFFALFLPKGLVDASIILGTLLLFLFLIPCGVYFIWFSEKSYLYLALFYIIIIVVFGGLYLLVSKFKYKHIKALNRVRELRIKLHESKKKQKRIKKQIIHDKDESQYGLEDYDNELASLELEINKLTTQKRNALISFDNDKRISITNEIKNRNQKELDRLNSEYNITRNRNKLNGDHINGLTARLTNKYEAFLGKNMMTIEKISQLEQLMSSHKLGTISEAISLMKKQES